MKKTISGAVLLLVLALAVERGAAQINSMRQQAAPAPATATKPTQMAPAATRQPTPANASKTVKNQMGGARTLQVQPVPKKILLFSRNRQLTLRAQKTLLVHLAAAGPVPKSATSSAAAQMQAHERIVEAGVLGVSSRKFNGNHTVSHVLTSATAGWLPNPAYDIKAGARVADNSDPSWNCTTTVESVDAQSTSFMNASKNEQGQHLYPGAVYAFDDYANGNFRPFETGLNPMEIFTNVRADQNGFTVPAPNSATIHQAISNIVRQFTADQGGATVLQQTLYSDNESDMAIAISAGGAYDGYSASDSFNHDQSEHHIYITLDAIKSLYTISAQRPANGFFANGQLPRASSALVMVQDVTYGARILANIDITITSKTDLNKFQFAYNAIAANGFVNVDALAHDASISYKINAYMVGVPTSTGLITTLQDFQGQLDRIFSQCNYRNAVPIQYSLVDMDGNQLGVESMTDKFPVRNCTPAAEVFTLQSVFVTLKTGSDNMNADSQLRITLYGNNDRIVGLFTNSPVEYKSYSTNTEKMTLMTDFTDGHPPYITLDDFSNGGMLEFNFDWGVAFGRTGDDWDVAGTHVVFTFLSQKGTVLPKDFYLDGFRLSAGNGRTSPDDKKFYFDNAFNAIK